MRDEKATMQIARLRNEDHDAGKTTVTWLVRNSRGVTEEVIGWALEVVDGALVLRGGQSQLLRAWGPSGWTTVERKA
jgi:hypothetical protein